MPAMPPGLMEMLMSDPEMMAAMSNPRTQAILMECMSNPAKLQQYAAQEPAIARLLEKLMQFGGGGMGGMGGGGMGGGFGGMGGGPPSSGVVFEDLDDDDEPPPLVNQTSVDDVD